MKTIKLLIGAVLCTSLLLTAGCAFFRKDSTTTEKAAEVKNLIYAAASIGADAALTQNPGWRPQFEIAYADLNQLVESKVVTGILLREIFKSLPVDELKSDTARIAIDGATTLYDATVGDKLNIEAQPYVMAAASGLRDGIKAALSKHTASANLKTPF